MRTGFPKLGVGALVGVVVQDNEIANALKLKAALCVVGVDVDLTETLVGKKLNQLRHRCLNQVNAGGLKRL